MSDILKDIKTALESFEKSITKDLTEVQKQKEAVQALSEQIHNTTTNGRYVHDDNRIIISAPEIIIGNVDHHGNLIGGGGGSIVVVRGNNVSLEGVGNAGTISNRAPSIKSVAVDPGCDGMHAVVGGVSEVVSQARSVTLLSYNDEGSFVRQTATGGIGINLETDTMVNVSATPGNKTVTDNISAQLTNISKSSADLEKESTKMMTAIDKAIEQIQKLVKDQDKYNDDSDDLCNDYNEVDKLNRLFQDQERLLCAAIGDYVRLVTMRMELKRREKDLKAKKDKLSPKASAFAKDTTGSCVKISSETITMQSIDGDGNLRENEEAGFFAQVPHASIVAHDKEGKLIADSTLGFNLQHMDIATSNPKIDVKSKKGDILADGDITINSKAMTINAVDGKLENGEITESALTKDGELDIRFETVNISNTDTEGKSTGTIYLNAKMMNITSMDVDKEEGTDKEMAKGSQLTILADKTFFGSNKDKKAASLVQIAGKEVGIMGKETAEVQQDGKAVLTLTGGNVTTGGSKIDVKGNTTIEGNADIKGEVKAPKVTADQGSFSAAFKSPTINDTMGAGVPAPAGTPSAKMTEEDAKN